jgi:hypothetical protein
LTEQSLELIEKRTPGGTAQPVHQSALSNWALVSARIDPHPRLSHTPGKGGRRYASFRI